jgi:hypothetical protein
VPPLDSHTRFAPHRSHGCLWGCLGAAVFFVLMVGGGIGYTAWTGWRILHRADTQLTTVLAAVRADPRAFAVVGGDFRVVQIQRMSSLNRTAAGLSGKTILQLGLSGPRGVSRVDASLVGKTNTVISLILTGPAGEVVRIVPREASLPQPAPPNSI